MINIKSGDDAIKLIYSILSALPALAVYVNDRVYPTHLDTIDQQGFPCVTMASAAGETMVSAMGYEGTIQIDVWSKVDRDEIWAIYLLVRKALNLQKVGFRCREISVNDNLYESSTYTHHLAAKFRLVV